MKQGNVLLVAMVLVALVIVLSLGVAFYERDYFTGHATDTGTANLTIVSQASVSFITSTVNWGSGAVDEVPTYAIINTEGTVTDGNWTAVSQGLTLQNDGNTNVTLYFTTSNVASTFIGGTTPQYQIKLSDNETGACVGTNSLSTYTEATGTLQLACNNTGYIDSADAVDLDIQLRIPEDALPGAKGSIITATATPI